MPLSGLLLAITLTLWGVSLLGWVAVSAWLLGLLAFITGVLMLLDGLSVFSYSLPGRRRD